MAPHSYRGRRAEAWRNSAVRGLALRLKPEELEVGQGIANLAHELGLVPKFDVRNLTNTELMAQAYQEIQAGR